MPANPFLGVIFHWLGGLAAASFYVPYRSVKRWSWEIYWITGGVFSWVVAPWFFASIQTNDLMGVLSATPSSTIGYCVLFGCLWGFGGLTYGLTMRYLGLSLGMAVVLGLCTVFGTLIPPIFQGTFASTLISSPSGNIILLGLLVTLAGIITVALAGAKKGEPIDNAAIAEFDFKKGIGVAIFSGVMSSCFAFGLAAGEPIRQLSAAAGTGPLWVGLPVLCIVMFGGLITNAVWCGILIARNKSAGQFIGKTAPEDPALPVAGKLPLALNYLFSAVAGTIWYFQFFFYTMGESQMGRFGFSSWTLHMASIIIFGALWGFAFKEWKGAPTKARLMVFSGIGLLILATVIIGYGNYIGR